MPDPPSKPFRKSVWAETTRHRGRYLLFFVLSGLPLAIGTIWPSLTHETVPEWLAENGWPSLTILTLVWVAVAALIAVVILLRSYQAARKSKTELDPETRNYLIERLKEFIRESSEIDRQDTVTQITSGFTFRGKVQHFLSLHFTEEHVVRFRERNVFALEETIGELLGINIPKQLPDESAKAAIAEVASAAKPEPNIIMLGLPRLTFVTHDEKFVFRECLPSEPNQEQAVVVDFQNQLEAGREIKGLNGVLSQLTFSSATGEMSHPVNRGFWLGHESPEATFERGDTRSLFLGYLNKLADIDKQTITTFDGRYETPVPVTFSPDDSISVRIALFTQTRHRFHKECELELTPQLRVTKPFA